MELVYDSKTGLYLPPGMAQEMGRGTKAPPNPDRAPPLDPYFVRELNGIGERVGRQYRWHWMLDMRVWGIQVRRGGDHWQTVHAHYDEATAWSGNWYPYLPPSRKALEEFCQTDLKIRYGTGNLAKDNMMRDAEVDETARKQKEANQKRITETIARKITGDDPKRFERLIEHERAHGGDGITVGSGIRFQEFFTGFGPGKKAKKKTKKGKKK